jgi:secreted Zn-dependent insulinase-like peptidase
MIKKFIPATLLIAIGLFVFGAAAQAFHRGHEPLSTEPFETVLTPQQRQAIFSLVKADRAKLQALHERLHKAREALIDKLLSPEATVDVSQQTAELKAAQAAMIDERVAIAVAAHKMLSPQQLKDAAVFHSKLRKLHEQEAALLQQMQGGKGDPAASGDE